MLTNYARWYSFTPPQWPTLSPPLTSAGLLGSNIAHGAAGADQPLHLKVQILVLGLSHRDPGVAVHRHLTTPLAGIPEVWLSASGVATGFSSHPLSYEMEAFTAGGWKQPCFQPGPPDAAGPVSVATKNCYPSRVQLPRIPGALRQRRCGPGAITDPYGRSCRRVRQEGLFWL